MEGNYCDYIKLPSLTHDKIFPASFTRCFFFKMDVKIYLIFSEERVILYYSVNISCLIECTVGR